MRNYGPFLAKAITIITCSLIALPVQAQATTQKDSVSNRYDSAGRLRKRVTLSYQVPECALQKSIEFFDAGRPTSTTIRCFDENTIQLNKIELRFDSKGEVKKKLYAEYQNEGTCPSLINLELFSSGVPTQSVSRLYSQECIQSRKEEIIYEKGEASRLFKNKYTETGELDVSMAFYIDYNTKKVIRELLSTRIADGEYSVLVYYMSPDGELLLSKTLHIIDGTTVETCTNKEPKDLSKKVCIQSGS